MQNQIHNNNFLIPFLGENKRLQYSTTQPIYVMQLPYIAKIVLKIVKF
jgi:hypothetical protein